MSSTFLEKAIKIKVHSAIILRKDYYIVITLVSNDVIIWKENYILDENYIIH